MKKVSDFFGVEAFFDPIKKQFYFFWDEGDEEFICDSKVEHLLSGDSDSFTWEIIRDWYEDNKDRIDEMVDSDEPYYVKDIIKP